MTEPDKTSDPRTEPEHIRTPDHPPAFKSELGVNTGIEVGLPILGAGVVALFFAYSTRASIVWIVGGALIAIGLIVMVRNRRV